MKCIQVGGFFSFFSFLFCLSHRGSQTVSNLAGGVADVYFSITLIIDLNAVAATDNKGLKRDSLAESGEKKKRRGAGGAVHELYIQPTIRGACLIYEHKAHTA